MLDTEWEWESAGQRHLTDEEQTALWRTAQALTDAPLPAQVAWVSRLGPRERAQFVLWRYGPDQLWMGGIDWVPVLLARMTIPAPRSKLRRTLTNLAGSCYNDGD